jgi:hypothetical protein
MRLLYSLLCALPLLLASCSSSDPKSMSDAGYAALNKGDAKSALSSFDEALKELGTNTSDPVYLKAALGRCQALAKMGDKRTKDEFLALARARPTQVQVGDFSIVASELCNKHEHMVAIDILEAGKKMFPESPKIHELAKVVVASAKNAGDEAALNKLKGLGYTD